MSGTNQAAHGRGSSSRSRMRHGRSGRSMISATTRFRQPSREADFARYAMAALEELRTLWPTGLAGLTVDIVMAPLPTDVVVGQDAAGRRYPIDWRLSHDDQKITLFRARIENSVRNRRNKEPYLLQLLAEEALCRAVAQYLGVPMMRLLHGEGN